jgi:hypothetical protein
MGHPVKAHQSWWLRLPTSRLSIIVKMAVCERHILWRKVGTENGSTCVRTCVYACVCVCVCVCTYVCKFTPHISMNSDAVLTQCEQCTNFSIWRESSIRHSNIFSHTQLLHVYRAHKHTDIRKGLLYSHKYTLFTQENITSSRYYYKHK